MCVCIHQRQRSKSKSNWNLCAYLCTGRVQHVLPLPADLAQERVRPQARVGLLIAVTVSEWQLLDEPRLDGPVDFPRWTEFGEVLEDLRCIVRSTEVFLCSPTQVRRTSSSNSSGRESRRDVIEKVRDVKGFD